METDAFDERKIVHETCDMVGLDTAFIRVDAVDFVELTEDSFNNFMYFYEAKVLQLANAHGTNLLFSGYGGDEFISLGSMGVDSDLIFNGQWLSFLKRHPLSHPKEIVSYLLYRVLFPAIGYIPRQVIRGNLELLDYFKNEHKTIHKETLALFYCYRSRRDFHLNRLAMNQLAERTENWFITGYKKGVIYRYPLLDKRIIEYMLKVPSKLLVKHKRYPRIILRQITEHLLPDSVRWLVAKSNPTIFELTCQQAKERAMLFLPELDQFKANPNLYFIDFDKVERDLEKYRDADVRVPEAFELFRLLLTLKSLHELSTSYAQPVEV